MGAVVAGTALAAYGAYKANEWINEQNIKLASHAGMEFAARFAEEIRPKVMRYGGTNQLRFTVGNRIASETVGGMAPIVADKLTAKDFKGRLNNALNARQLSKGRKTVYDIFNYNQTLGEIMDEVSADSHLGKQIMDVLNYGGSIPREILRYSRTAR